MILFLYQCFLLLDNAKNVKNRSGCNIEYSQRQPSELKLGKDTRYYHDLYGLLCEYAHCNFFTQSCYINDNNLYSAEMNTNPFLTRVLVVFVYTKLFESIVTVEGEDFSSNRTEKICYTLVKNANLFLDDVLEKLSKHDADTSKYLNKHMKAMFKEMRKSLREEIGSLVKDFLD